MPQILLIFVIYRIIVRARLKGENPFKWAILTFLAFSGAVGVGVYFVIAFFAKNAITLSQLGGLDWKTQMTIEDKLIYSDPLNALTVTMFGIGGYLLVRYFLDKKPNKKGPEVHWMDKLGHQEEEK